jgi:hypothetical protein
MKPPKIIGAVVVALVIAAGVWWLTQPAPAPVRVAPVSAISNPAIVPESPPPSPQISSTAPPPPQTAPDPSARNEAGIYPGFGPQNVVPTAAANPQADLSTAFPNLLRILKSGDFMTLVQTYMAPSRLAGLPPEAVAQIQAQLASPAQDPQNQQRMQGMITAVEYAQTQTPVFSADGNTATYRNVLNPNVPNSHSNPGASPNIDMVWVKESGQWYLKD